MKKRIPAAALSLALLAPLAVPAAALEVEDARTLLTQYYVDPIPEAVLQADSLDEMLQLLGDPYTVYYTAEEYQQFLASIDGETLVGIGVSLQSAFDQGFEILSVLPDSPALEAGLQAGDKIIAVEGVTLTAQDNLSTRIAGEAGTPVTITIRRGSKELDVTMVRRAVQIPIVTYEQMGSIGYIDCSSFGESTFDTTKQALSTLDQDVCVWVMDLRSNPGGTATAASGTAGLFIGADVMSYFRSGDGGYRNYYTTVNCPDLTDKPLIVLTSAHSASGSELFSAAIRDHGVGIAIGQRTYGKGVAQTALDQTSHPELFDGDALKITVYRFFSPDGATNHICGILPTLLVDAADVLPIAQLLSTPAPEQSFGYLKLELAGQSFYLSVDALKEAPSTFARLLEALPPSARIFRGAGRDIWEETSAAVLAERYDLDYQPRTFSDAADSPYQREIDTLSTYKLLSGCEDGLFHPERTLTRAQLCAMLATALNLPASDAAPVFSDVAADAWYADAVSAMAARDFMAGTGNGAFTPDATITNQELVTILSSVYAWCSMEGYACADESLTPAQWLEFYAYPDWAQTAARNMAAIGLDVDPDAPAAAVTREAAAGMLCQLLEHMNMLWN